MVELEELHDIDIRRLLGFRKM